MAIVIEEEKNKKINFLGIIIWVVLIIIIISALYYIFFKRPELIPIATPSDLQSAEELAKIKLSPDEILGTSNFSSLKAHIQPLETPRGGKQNPFMGF